MEVTALSSDSDAAPNITILNYDRRALEIANLTGIDMIIYVPIVEASKKSEWESYAVQSQGWIEQDFVSCLSNLVTMGRCRFKF